jgi:Phage tail lysozyme
LSPAGAHCRQRKLVSTGRHAAPSPLAKATKQAGRIVPAVALAGALVAAPQVYHLATAGGAAGAPTAMAGDIADAQRAPVSGHSADDTARVSAIIAANVHAHVVNTGTTASKRPNSPASSPAPANSPAPAPAASSPARSPSPSPSAQATSKPAAQSELTCSGPDDGMLPANYPAIVSFLTAHGYTGLAAAGIAGNIYQESKGDPESVGTGGGGLIGWTPLPAGFVTGDPAADLQTQLEALLTYNDQWAQYIPALNAATTASQAAFIYMTDFERPGIPATGNREAAAQAVAAACDL